MENVTLISRTLEQSLSIQGRVNGIYTFKEQFYRDQKNQLTFNSVCISTDYKTKLLYLVALQPDQLEGTQFGCVSYSNKKSEDLIFQQVSHMIELNQSVFVCAHFDGSLTIYYRLKERQLKSFGNTYFKMLIEPLRINELNDINKIVIHISAFTFDNKIILRLQHYDNTTKEITLDNGFSIIKENPGPYSDFKFIKFIEDKEILCGFIDNKTFGIIQKDTDSQSLSDIKQYQIEDGFQQILELDSVEMIKFDMHVANSGYYIICVYQKKEGANEQTLCSFKLDLAEDSSLMLRQCFSLNLDHGGVNQIFSIPQKHPSFNYDVVVVFKHRLVAYNIFEDDSANRDGQIKSEIIFKSENMQSSQIREYVRYFYQIINNVPFHLLVTKNNETSFIEYFNLIELD